MAGSQLTCYRCKRTFKSKGGLTQHQRKSTVCFPLNGAKVAHNLPHQNDGDKLDVLAFTRAELTNRRQQMAKEPPPVAKLPPRLPPKQKDMPPPIANRYYDSNSESDNEDDKDNLPFLHGTMPTLTPLTLLLLQPKTVAFRT